VTLQTKYAHCSPLANPSVWSDTFSATVKSTWWLLERITEAIK
jgi:hypothetical protein